MGVYFVGLAVCISIVSAGQYAWSAWRGLSRPNPISWFFWGLVPLFTFFAQLKEGVGWMSLVTLVLGLSNMGIMGIAIYKHRLLPHLTPSTICCAIMAFAGIFLWLITDEPRIAIICSIGVDVFACLPTFVKTYRDPRSEYPMPYMLSAVVMVLTLCSIREWQFAAYAFPLYVLATNVAIFGLAISSYRPHTADLAIIVKALCQGRLLPAVRYLPIPVRQKKPATENEYQTR